MAYRNLAAVAAFEHQRISERSEVRSGACAGLKAGSCDGHGELLSPRAPADLGAGFTSLGTFRFPVSLIPEQAQILSISFGTQGLRNVDWGRGLSVVIAITVNGVPFLAVPSPR
jgi:hypothetical protein